ncbi:MAG: rhodanese-like domain-containing protein [Nostoc sp. ChiSLP02]|nr:rhodanese-like domain-containing protein [Nostoc sp. DedSLP05]MDZ8101907.1 rhodanese-like domain-containing protein [Nostoc sp. DedSLP01]MDZ8186150.1 rhodanese-like domain-containing protein [Nostoc sp. ChiSLP02]
MTTKLAANAHDLKSLLDWGQPNLTIIDVRDRQTYNQGRITGAISIPLADLASRAKSALHTERHIYVYGDSDENTASAVQLLKGQGFAHVAEIPGGLAAWVSNGGATEGAVA